MLQCFFGLWCFICPSTPSAKTGGPGMKFKTSSKKNKTANDLWPFLSPSISLHPLLLSLCIHLLNYSQTWGSICEEEGYKKSSQQRWGPNFLGPRRAGCHGPGSELCSYFFHLTAVDNLVHMQSEDTAILVSIISECVPCTGWNASNAISLFSLPRADRNCV